MKFSKKICLIIFILIALSILTMIVIPSYSMATSPIDNPEDYKPEPLVDEDTEAFTNKVKPIVNVISILGLVVAVITLIVLGIKYMLGSVEQKAEYKKTTIYYILGVAFLVSITGILQIIINVITPLAEDI